MVEFLKFLLKPVEIVVVGLLFESLQLLPEVILLNFELVNFFHSFFIALLPGSFLFAEVEFVGEDKGVVMVIDGADILKEVVEGFLLFGMAMHDILTN